MLAVLVLAVLALAVLITSRVSGVVPQVSMCIQQTCERRKETVPVRVVVEDNACNLHLYLSKRPEILGSVGCTLDEDVFIKCDKFHYESHDWDYCRGEHCLRKLLTG
jgi:hypothetical protein